MSKGDETRERILDGALRLASLEGIEGLTVGGLATALGMSKSGLFAHFGSKEELQVQVLKTAIERFRQVVVEPALKARRGVPRLRALFERWLEWTNDASLPGGCIFVAAAVELDDKAGPARDFLVRAQQGWLQTLARAARIAMQEGQLRADLDPEQFAYEVWSLALGYHHLRRLLRDPQASARVHAAFDRLLGDARARS